MKKKQKVLTPIPPEDGLLVSRLKQEGILVKFSPQWLFGQAKFGGVAFLCGDRNPDMWMYHQRVNDPSAVKLFGGPLFLASSFKGFNQIIAEFLRANIKLGMRLKSTGILYLYFHAPCGLVKEHGHTIAEVIGMASQAKEFLLQDEFFRRKKVRIHLLFHVVRTNKADRVEQNTYRIAPNGAT